MRVAMLLSILLIALSGCGNNRGGLYLPEERAGTEVPAAGQQQYEDTEEETRKK